MIINHNIAALNTYRQLSSNQNVGQKSLEKLSSGLRINKAGDDAAGLAISEKMRAQIRGLDQASRNAQDSISLIQTAEGGLNETHSILQRMRELANQAASDTNVGIDREEIQKEINQLTSEINRIGNTTEFNTMKLLNGGTSRTANIRYGVETAGIAGTAATGELSAVNVQTASVAAGNGAADLTTNTGSVADNPVGAVENWDQTASSVTAGTGTKGAWTEVTDSKKEAKAGEIGSPLTQMEASSTGGAVVIQKAAHLTGADAYNIDAADITVDQTTDGIDDETASFTIDFGTFATGLEAGTVIEIGGVVFTAVANNAGAGEFKIGATAADTVANLAAAMKQNTGMWDGTVDTTTGITATGTEITITANAINTQIKMGTFETEDTTDDAAIAAELEVQATNATYSFEVLENFKAGDSITVGGETFIARDGGAAGANEFNIGATVEATVAALQAKMQAHASIGGGGYTVGVGGPGWGAGGTDDVNSITITKTAAGEDTRANQFTGGLDATKGDAVAGTYKFELNTNFEVGSTITIDGQTFTAVDAIEAGKEGEQFLVGTTLSDTAKNLLDAIDANLTLSAKFHAAVLKDGNTAGGADIVGTGLATDADTIVLQEKVASGNDMATVIDDGVTSQDQAAQKASYKFELTANFSDGDKITIGGTEFTAGTDFVVVDGDIETTLDNLATAINSSTLNTGFTATASGAELTIEENVADGDKSDVQGLGPAIDNRAEVKASYNFDITENLMAGEKIIVGGQTFTAVDGGAVAADGTFDISGGTTDDTAASLKAAMAALLTDYDIDGTGSNITITEKNANAGGEADPLSGLEADVSARDEVAGDYTVKLTANFSVGDKITIGGVEFEAVAEGATGDQFAAGGNINETTENLKAAIAGNAALGARFNVNVVENQVDAFTVEKEISLVEKPSQATGTDIELSIDNVDAVEGVYTFDIDTNFAVGDRVNINGQIFTAVGSDGENTGSTFIVGEDASATTANLAAAIAENTTLDDAYDILTSGASIALTEKNATGDDLTDPQVLNGAGTAGEYKFQMSALKAGSAVTIDNQKLTLAGGGTETETAAALKEAIEADAALNAKYAVAVSGAEVTLTQKEGQESATAPTLAYTTNAGDGYRAQMQIGANTGQSMSLDVNDMRANALGVTSVTGSAGQTVEVEGKQYAVAWTSNQSVTNGTDDIAVEFALDVSTHDNATASVKVINDAIERVSAERSKLGAFQNRLEHTINNLGTSSENLTAAESRIRDVDMAKEMMEFTKMNILSQAAQAMLAQANQLPQQVLQLLR